jgi:hypothetical protein
MAYAAGGFRSVGDGENLPAASRFAEAHGIDAAVSEPAIAQEPANRYARLDGETFDNIDLLLGDPFGKVLDPVVAPSIRTAYERASRSMPERITAALCDAIHRKSSGPRQLCPFRLRFVRIGHHGKQQE